MRKVLEEKYEGNTIYAWEEKYLLVAKKVLEGSYQERLQIKNSKRNFVSLIEVEGETYVYKEPRNEYRIPQRKFFSCFKRGEALNTFINIEKLRSEGFLSLARSFAVVNRRKYGFITFSFFLMEYIDGRDDRAYLEDMVSLVEDLHRRSYYHGDFNPGNCLVKDGKVYLIDSQFKKMLFGNYRAHYDMLTMKLDSYEEMEYPYEKNGYYYLAYLVKKLKKLPWIRKFKRWKQGWRDRGLPM